MLLIIGFVVLVPILYLAKVIKPPRPMFHNWYVYNPHNLSLPRWWQHSPFQDGKGTIAFFDVRSNLLVICYLDDPAFSELEVKHEHGRRSGSLTYRNMRVVWRYGMAESSFVVNGHENVLSSAAHDSLVILLPDGGRAEFSLQGDRARQVFMSRLGYFERGIVKGLLDDDADGPEIHKYLSTLTNVR